jgi:hypothetical protein
MFQSAPTLQRIPDPHADPIRSPTSPPQTTNGKNNNQTKTETTAATTTTTTTTTTTRYQILKPHMPGIIFQVLFGLLCFSDTVWASWRESPEDFVSREFESSDDCIDLRRSASCLIADAVKLRPSL